MRKPHTLAIAALATLTVTLTGCTTTSDILPTGSSAQGDANAATAHDADVPERFTTPDEITDDPGNFYKVTGPADFGADEAEADAALSASRAARDAGEPMPIIPPMLPEVTADNSYDTDEQIKPAFTVISTVDRIVAKERGRIKDLPNPSAWPDDNPKVEVTYPSGVDYSGYFWNRSHLIADSLGGWPQRGNLIAGTRAQNVGDNKTPGGMGYTEDAVRDYLDKQINDAEKRPDDTATSGLIAVLPLLKKTPRQTVDVPVHATCDVAYQSVPNYTDDEVIPRTVTVNVRSCDNELDEQVTVYNVMPGYAIDYHTGDATSLSGSDRR